MWESRRTACSPIKLENIASRVLVESNAKPSRAVTCKSVSINQIYHHFLVATRQCSTSTCRMHLKLCSIPIIIICDIIYHSFTTAHRSGARKKGAPVTLSSNSNWQCSALGRRLIAPACLSSKSIKQIAVAFPIQKKKKKGRLVVFGGFLCLQKRRILASSIRGFAHTTCAAKCGLGAIEFGDATDLPSPPSSTHCRAKSPHATKWMLPTPPHSAPLLARFMSAHGQFLFLLGCDCHSRTILTLSQWLVVCASESVCLQVCMCVIMCVLCQIGVGVCVNVCAPARVRFIWV